MFDPQQWLQEHSIEFLETFVADFAGSARGKIMPVSELKAASFKLPIAIFGQTINGTYYMRADNDEDRDMAVRPAMETLRHSPWAAQPTASVLLDCANEDGSPIDLAPRAVLQNVLAKMADQGWVPVVAPEVEFYLQADADNESREEQPELSSLADPYGVDRVHDLGRFFNELSSQCERQSIALGALSQELGPGQFEVNFQHGDALRVADDVFHFKRTLKRLARDFGMRATFLAKLDVEKPGSSLHIHQSVYDAEGQNIFSNPDGSASEAFMNYMGGLQQHMRSALLFFAPYPNSYRRFINYWSSPANLEWDVDNRTVGLRVPRCDAKNRRIENRLAGSDVNPYLAIAASLACGYLGLTDKAEARPAVTGSAYELAFALNRHLYDSIESLRSSSALSGVLGEEFVALYTAVKERENREFQERVPEWEREDMAFLL